MVDPAHKIPVDLKALFAEGTVARVRPWTGFKVGLPVLVADKPPCIQIVELVGGQHHWLEALCGVGTSRP